jgi:hypothetical protein
MGLQILTIISRAVRPRIGCGQNRSANTLKAPGHAHFFRVASKRLAWDKR